MATSTCGRSTWPSMTAERVAEVLVQEGDHVHRPGPGAARHEPPRAAARASPGAASRTAAVVDRLHHGNRPEEIAQARAALVGPGRCRECTTLSARFEALRSSGGRAVSQQDLDNAKAALDVAEAKLASQQQDARPRVARTAQGRHRAGRGPARRRAGAGRVAEAAAWPTPSCVAPLDAVVRSRLMEPGDMASPQKTASSRSRSPIPNGCAPTSRRPTSARCVREWRRGSGRQLSRIDASRAGSALSRRWPSSRRRRCRPRSCARASSTRSAFS